MLGQVCLCRFSYSRSRRENDSDSFERSSLAALLLESLLAANGKKNDAGDAQSAATRDSEGEEKQSKHPVERHIGLFKKMCADELDDYSILGVSASATLEDCKKAWKALVLAHHPDIMARAGQNSPEEIRAATERTKAINDAYGRIKAGTPRIPSRAPSFSYGAASAAHYGRTGFDDMKKQWEEFFGAEYSRHNPYREPPPPPPRRSPETPPSSAEQARRNYDEQWRREQEREAHFEQHYSSAEDAAGDFWAKAYGAQGRNPGQTPFGGRAHSFANSGANKSSNRWAPGRR